ncbi:phage tail family protein [Clostridium botulinum]|uniref:Phage tail family protein n=1 Tax=Clostridium botulinum TaxID=1491 RepID=A0A846J9R0_CLOBO|nr:phage tail family protein [Clostridium botulinum]ACA54179.1 conserved domain protein [Clostridium botulinum A3 str. Loch Maree]NFH66874.1 phage tail family protein [Clostridium botulinum]NFJ10609.1 phage tail family protein [Clostridium botulinum]NFK15529.1 phage tail family protein [Clostridium botulinum]NFM95409.1 phage tail family protein [Clostridium botulinum]
MNKKEKFIFENEKGQQIEFSIWSHFFLQNIDGISGLKNTIYSNKGMEQDGSTCVGSTLDDRNIVIQGSIIDNKEINREKLLSIINPKLQAKLIYTDGNIRKYVECIVETSPIIPKENRPKFQISLLCNNPYWKDYIDSKVNIALWKGDFHFPLVIPQGKGITMGHREPSLIVNVLNNGQVKTGMIIEFLARGTLSNPSLFNVNTREFIKINKGMVAGEKFIINTNYSKKKILQELNGVTTDILNYLDIVGGGDTFLQLDVGDNLFRYNADSNLDNLEVNIYFSQQYLGV